MSGTPSAGRLARVFWAVVAAFRILLPLSIPISRSSLRRAVPVLASLTFLTQDVFASPELPRHYMDTRVVAASGATIPVLAGGDFQAALDQAQPGDVITLEPGATFEGRFTLPAKSGPGWVIVRTAAPDSSLPPPGVRIDASYAPVLPKIVTPDSGPALQTAPGAHHFRFIGVEFTVGAGVTSAYDLLRLGDGSSAQDSLADVPHHLILDRVYIHGNSAVNLRRGIALNSAWTAIVDSYISDVHEVGADSQAIAGWNGPGPFKIVNNYLEAAGENAMFGGADPSIAELVPSDIEVRGNHCYKPLSWRKGDPSYAGVPWTVKNLFELKNARRVLIEDNAFEHNWLDAQNGFAILFTVRNQDGTAPWSVVEDVTFARNTVRHTGSAVNILGKDDIHPSQQTRRILIEGNLFEDVDGAKWGGAGRLFQLLSGTADVVIDHNTAFHTGDVIGAEGEAHSGFVYTNNLTAHNQYGVGGSGTYGDPLSSLATYFPSATFVGNVLTGGNPLDYPPGNFFPRSWAEVEFVALAAGDYRLSDLSPYKNGGTDGKDIGADIGAIRADFISWNTTLSSDGSHTLTALASDATGNEGTSAAVTATVSDSVATADVLQIASVSLDRPTLHALGVQMRISGDANRNAKVAVRYRKLGTTPWRDGPPLFRVFPETVVYSVPEQFAGSIFDLSPDTTYEIELRATDSDGPVNDVRFINGRTRPVPRKDPLSPRVVNVASASVLRSALSAALPGDVITIANGTYLGTFKLDKSGTADNPIVVRGASMSGVVLDGQNCTGCDVFAVSGSYVHIENLTLQNAIKALRFYGTGTRNNVARRLHIKNVVHGVGEGLNQSDFHICDNIIEGRLVWPWVYAGDATSHWGDRGVSLHGQGHVVCHNRMKGFGDPIVNRNELHRSDDYYGNDFLDNWDGLEVDGGSGNIRVWRNRWTNVAAGISVQPVHGGPAYLLRNVVLNVKENQIKFKADASGMLAYHNTFVSPKIAVLLEGPGSSTNFQIMNNLFVGPPSLWGRTVEWRKSIDRGVFNYNGYFPDGGFQFGSQLFSNFAQVKASGKFEGQGLLLIAPIFATGLVGPSGDGSITQLPADFTLASASNAKDRGTVLIGFNTAFKGTAPDFGAYELGCPNPTYGPRPVGSEHIVAAINCVMFETDPSADSIPPTVSMTAPGAGSIVSGTITVSASASDNVAVAGVQFVLDGANLGVERTASPYAISWDTTIAANGIHSLTAVARDTSGNTATSSAVIVTVSNIDTTPPMISGVSASIGSPFAATISWTTNEPSDTQVEYGLTTAYGILAPLSTTRVTAHSQTLSGLAAGTLCHYRVRSRDATGNLALSGDFTLTTLAPPPPDLVAYRSPTPITVDGVQGEWTGATPVQFSGLSNGVTARLAWDATNLYVAFQVSDMQLSALETIRDSGLVWQDDSVEVYVDTLGDRASAMQPDDYQFLVNLNNAQVDLRGTGTGKDLSWNGTWTSAVSHQGTLNNNGDADSGYVVEMAIPWAQLGVTPSAGMYLGLDLVVNDRDPASATALDHFDWAQIPVAPGAWTQPDLWKWIQLVDTPPLPDLVVYRPPTPITVDGVQDEWAGATPVQFSGLSNGVSAHLAWDATKLYVVFQVTDTQLSALETTRDSGVAWQDDSVEVYIDTLGDRASAMQPDDYQFLVNLNNAQVDLRGTGTGKDSTWNGTWTSAVSRQGTLNNNGDVDSGYVVEMAIPWAQLGVTPAAGMYLGLDLVVNDRDPASATTLDHFDWARIPVAPGGWAQPHLWKWIRLVDTTPRVVDTLALFNPSQGWVSLIASSQDQPPVDAYTTYAAAAPVLGQWVMGDWNGDGTKTPAVYGDNGAFYYTNDLGQTSNWTGIWFGFLGRPPVAGRFDAVVGRDCLGVMDSAPWPGYGTAFALYFTCDLTSGANPPKVVQWLGAPLPDSGGFSGVHQFAAGDFDGNGVDSVAVRRGPYIAWTNVPPTTLLAENDRAQYIGAPGVDYGNVVAGDWDGNGRDSFGLFYPDGSFYRRDDLEWNSELYTLQRVGQPIGAPVTASSWRPPD